MRKTTLNKKKRTKNLPSLSTKKSKEYTHTFRRKSSRGTAALSDVVNLFRATVTGVSMWPTIRNNYSVFYRKHSADFLEPGDIIVFRGKDRKQRNIIKVHRYLGRVGPYLLEAGDNTFHGTLLEEGNLLGRVEKIVDQKGRRINPRKLAELGLRQRAFLQLAHGFMYIHEAKDRLVGGRKSLLLWKLSQVYRGGLKVVGLEVPPIFPRY